MFHPIQSHIIDFISALRATVISVPSTIYTNGQMTEPSQLLSIYVTIKTHWINTQAGTAISTIHSLSRPLPLTFENFCPAVLFAL